MTKEANSSNLNGLS